MPSHSQQSGVTFRERLVTMNHWEKIWAFALLGYLLLVAWVASEGGSWAALEVTCLGSVMTGLGPISKRVGFYWRDLGTGLLILVMARAFWLAMLLEFGFRSGAGGIFFWQGLLGNLLWVPWLAGRLHKRTFVERPPRFEELKLDEHGNVLFPSDRYWVFMLMYMMYMVLVGLEPAFWLFLNRSLSWEVQP